MPSVTQIAQKYMDLLPTSADGAAEMPMPKFLVVNNLVSRWNGIAMWDPSASETLIKIQKAVTKDEQTLNRIVAHEICHAWAYWKCFTVQEYPTAKAKGHSSTSAWYEAAHIINQREGDPLFITEKSDETYVETQERSFYVYLESGPNGIWWAWFARVDEHLRRNLLFRIRRCEERGGRCTVIKTNDTRFLLPGAKLPDAKRLHDMPENMIEKINTAIRENPIRENDADANAIISRAKVATDMNQVVRVNEVLNRIKSPGLEKLRDKTLSLPKVVFLGFGAATNGTERIRRGDDLTAMGPKAARLLLDGRLVIVEVGDEDKLELTRMGYGEPPLPMFAFKGSKKTKILFAGTRAEYDIKSNKLAGYTEVTCGLERLKSPGLQKLKEKMETVPEIIFIPFADQHDTHFSRHIRMLNHSWFAVGQKRAKTYRPSRIVVVVQVSEGDIVVPNGKDLSFRGSPHSKIIFEGKVGDYFAQKTAGLSDVTYALEHIKSPGLQKLKKKLLIPPKIVVIPFGGTGDGHHAENIKRCTTTPWAAVRLGEARKLRPTCYAVILEVTEGDKLALQDNGISFSGSPASKVIFEGELKDYFGTKP